jgi:hypothetical protein
MWSGSADGSFPWGSADNTTVEEPSADHSRYRGVIRVVNVYRSTIKFVDRFVATLRKV